MFNQTFKFSFAHIVSFVALLGITYMVFMGCTYWTGGDMFVAGIAASTVFVVLLSLIYIIQSYKAADHKFARKIVLERIWVAVMLLVSVASFLPLAHFWTVYQQDSLLKETFGQSISSGKKILTTYEQYASSRIEALESSINSINGSDTSPYMAQQKQHRLNGASLRLLPQSYNKFKADAITWIDDSSQEVTAMNVFLLGNVDGIESAFRQWHQFLFERSNIQLAGEPEAVAAFDEQEELLNEPLSKLQHVRDIFSRWSAPTPLAYLVGLLLFALLSLPYHIQGRHTKAKRYYGFWKARPQSASSLMDSTPREQTQSKRKGGIKL